MQFKQYKELIEKEEQLQEDMKNFILKSLKENDGRITYISPNADDDETSLDDKYPVISTLYGKHGTYNVAITDVYLQEQENCPVQIYVDGIEQEFEMQRKEFLIYPEQFSDIIHFITAPIREGIHSYAERLALKDLVDKYNKLPHDFLSEYGRIKTEYSRENWDNILKYTEDLEGIYMRCSEPDCNKDEINSDLMAIVCDLAELVLFENKQKLIKELTEDVEEETRYTEEAQDEFNSLYDEIEELIWLFMKFEGID